MIESLCYGISPGEGEAAGEKVAGEEQGCGICLGGKRASKGKETGVDCLLGPSATGAALWVYPISLRAQPSTEVAKINWRDGIDRVWLEKSKRF